MTSVTAPYAVISNLVFTLPPIAPSITVTSPSSLSLATYAGSSAVFQLQTFVSGSTPLSYQWQQDGGLGGAFFNILDAATNDLTVSTTGVPPGNYHYQLVVTNSVGSSTSSVVVVTVAAIPSAPAQGVAWGQALGITGDWDVSTNGVGLCAFGMTLAPVTVNSVTFKEFDPSYTGGFVQDLAASLQITNSGARLLTSVHGDYYYNAFGGGASAPFASLSTNYQTLLSCGIGEDPGGADTWTLSFTNLAPKLEYEIELWANDSRNAQAGTTEILSDPTGTNPTGVLTVAAARGVVGELGTYIIGTAAADTNGAITVLINNGVDPSGQPTLQINAFQLRELAPRLDVNSVNGKIQISWTGPGSLQQSPVLSGLWATTTNGGASPFMIVPSLSQQFYRLRLQ
jgi:hypothetical protein